MKLLKINFIFAMLSTLLLSSCLSPVKTAPPSTYVINALPSVPHLGTHRVALLVGEPEVDSAYATTQMAYTQRPYQISYYVENRWAATPAQMLQPLIVQSLLRTNYFQAIVTPPFIGRYDYILSTQIVKLQQNFTRQPAVVEWVVNAQLSRVLTNQVIATKQFSISQPMIERNPYAGVVATNRAVERFLNQLTEFCLRSIRR